MGKNHICLVLSSLKMWCEDFSYDFYECLLKKISIKYKVSLFTEALQLNEIQKPCIFIRHDIDISPRVALRMAMIEQMHGIRSTYMIMNRPFTYSLDNQDHVNLLLRISDLGHDLGLHYVSTDIDKGPEREGILRMKLAGAREMLQGKINRPINSFSFHIPDERLMGGPLIISDMINAYSSELMGNYISDSKGTWREGNPMARLDSGDKDVTQILVHPIWYGEKHLIAEERIQEFFDEELKINQDRFSNRLDNSLCDVGIKVLRRNIL